MAVHTIRIGALQRHLPVVPVSDDVSIAFLKLYGDIELLEVATAALADQLTDDAEVIVGPESAVRAVRTKHRSATCGHRRRSGSVPAAGVFRGPALARYPTPIALRQRASAPCSTGRQLKFIHKETLR